MNSFLDSENLILEFYTYYTSYVCTTRVSRGRTYHTSFSASSNISASDACNKAYYKALRYIASQPQLAETNELSPVPEEEYNGDGDELIIIQE